MCEVCHLCPCDPRCPNAPDPKTVFICAGCSLPITEGDDYWDILGEQFCRDCVDAAQKEAVYDPE